MVNDQTQNEARQQLSLSPGILSCSGTGKELGFARVVVLLSKCDKVRNRQGTSRVLK